VSILFVFCQRLTALQKIAGAVYQVTSSSSHKTVTIWNVCAPYTGSLCKQMKSSSPRLLKAPATCTTNWGPSFTRIQTEVLLIQSRHRTAWHANTPQTDELKYVPSRIQTLSKYILWYLLGLNHSVTLVFTYYRYESLVENVTELCICNVI
jgi:hypothetical protein